MRSLKAKLRNGALFSDSACALVVPELKCCALVEQRTKVLGGLLMTSVRDKTPKGFNGLVSACLPHCRHLVNHLQTLRLVALSFTPSPSLHSCWSPRPRAETLWAASARLSPGTGQRPAPGLGPVERRWCGAGPGPRAVPGGPGRAGRFQGAEQRSRLRWRSRLARWGASRPVTSRRWMSGMKEDGMGVQG